MKFQTVSTEGLNIKPDAYEKYYVTIPMKWTIFGKEIAAGVDFQMNADGTMDPRVVDAFNKFFPKLDLVIKSNMNLILKEVNIDATTVYGKNNPNPVGQQDIEKNFDGVTSCFVGIEKIDAGGQVAYADHVVAMCDLEWAFDPKKGGDDRFDAEHGNGLAIVDGKFYMGKPGDFY